MELYRRLGYLPQQIEQLRSMRFFTGKMMAWWIAGFYLLSLIYLIWIKKYFRKSDVHPSPKS